MQHHTTVLIGLQYLEFRVMSKFYSSRCSSLYRGSLNKDGAIFRRLLKEHKLIEVCVCVSRILLIKLFVQAPGYGIPVRTEEAIPLDKLKQHGDILFYDSVPLYEGMFDDVRHLDGLQLMMS